MMDDQTGPAGSDRRAFAVGCSFDDECPEYRA